jgi:hypothetical protein
VVLEDTDFVDAKASLFPVPRYADKAARKAVCVGWAFSKAAATLPDLAVTEVP